MSRHYVSTRHCNIFRGTQDIGTVIDKVAAVRPELAKKLARMDWGALRKHVAKEALQRAVVDLNERFKSGGFKLEPTFHKPSLVGRDQEERDQVEDAYRIATAEFSAPRFAGEECLGVVKHGDTQVGVFAQGTSFRCREMIDTRQGSRVRGSTLIKDAINKAYTEKSIEGALKILGNSEVQSVRQEDGTLIMETEIKDTQKVVA